MVYYKQNLLGAIKQAASGDWTDEQDLYAKIVATPGMNELGFKRFLAIYKHKKTGAMIKAKKGTAKGVAEPELKGLTTLVLYEGDKGGEELHMGTVASADKENCKLTFNKKSAPDDNVTVADLLEEEKDADYALFSKDNPPSEHLVSISGSAPSWLLLQETEAAIVHETKEVDEVIRDRRGQASDWHRWTDAQLGVEA
mmetsp:Transcript_26111/g.57688  ORF Transcript_26111/g.57688 Transcript_26111/m.57688 type:complete len:198 (-) Transcript_26111:51-644(-)|eukprot:CAMPEP_0204251556 /NCGR_PEP_ID=MMETSP0468-20130131/349_1 /ASSEMBLY_ACC=CAM_ASM_000383 /TAXON_ID=2969 /ORGANISM="Oxyrrhis marina" /LENGTH=197 /DNA_ID=CAMNT_0051224861 /DNA_START=63 /DNA_END=656 /DNA_ORIENTATION=+